MKRIRYEEATVVLDEAGIDAAAVERGLARAMSLVEAAEKHAAGLVAGSSAGSAAVDHVAWMSALGLAATCWLPTTVRVGERLLSLPRDLVGSDGKTVIIHRAADESYDFAGWEPWHAGYHGGRYQEIGHALGWLERLRVELAVRSKAWVKQRV